MKKKMHNPNEYKRWRRHKRVRNRVVGTPERPRVCVFRSNAHIYAQIIDDTAGRTLVSVSSLKLEVPATAAAPAAEGKAKGKKAKDAKDAGAAAAPAGRKKVLAREVGRLLAEAAKEKGVSKVAFDRGGYLYHGRVAELAESARKHGLDF
jgi:large subunit ribosomal protein L18